MNALREALRKLCSKSFKSGRRFGDEHLHSIPELGNAGPIGKLAPVAAGDLIDSVMRPPTADCHREFGPFEWKLVSAVSDDRPSR